MDAAPAPPLSAELIDRFAAIVGARSCIWRPEELRTYECDGLTSHRALPGLVVLPASREEVVEVVRLAHREGLPIVPRGSGTGLSGGAMPVPGGIVLGLSRMTRILEIDFDNQWMRVEPGVINLEVSRQLAARGCYYAPDPSSQQVCTIGGNVAENSGGAHCLKYGFTTNHVLGATVVLPDGEVALLGGPVADPLGYDLRGALVGSEGTLGVVVEVVLRILRRPEATRTLFATFPSTEEAGNAVSRIIAAGIVPAAIEMMDRLAIVAIKAATGVDWPDVGAALLMDVDGPLAEVEHTAAEANRLAQEAGALELRVPRDDAERDTMWRGRKSAFAAMGRISPSYVVQDGVIPRSEIAQVLRAIEALSVSSGLRIANVFHAGDGNLHPLVLYDAKVPGQEALAEQTAGEILKLCVQSGGSITGEHGVGADKASYMGEMFSDADLATMHLVRCTFDPEVRMNPGKVFPTPRLCGDRPGTYVAHATELTGARGARVMIEATERDAILGVRPRVTYAPATVEEAAELMTSAARDQLRLGFIGGGTALELGSPPAALDAVVRTERLAHIIEYAPADMIVVVQAGVTLAALQAELGAHGQRLALDPPSPERATIGGLVATGAFGPLRARHGGIRDLIIGVTLVRADGAIAHGGGKVVKNVAGFDLPKLACGSLGTLGLIAAAAFRLHPLPETTATVIAPAVTAADVVALVAAARDAQLEPACVVALGARDRFDLAVRFEGFERGVAHQVARFVALAGTAAEHLDAATAAAFWHRHDAVRAAAPLRVRVAALPTRFPEVAARLAGLGDLAWYATLGVGFAGGALDEVAAVTRARDALVAEGGALVVEAAPAELRTTVDPWGPPPPSFALMQRLKQRFDPERRLNPGRFVGGL